jgi:hypothetical protein
MIITEIEKRESYTLLRIGRWPDQNEMKLAEQWCQRSQCGKRVNINSFAFKNEVEITMFRLKWETHK